MAGHEKNLRDEPEGENWTNGAREESRSASQDEIPTRKGPAYDGDTSQAGPTNNCTYPGRLCLGKRACWTGEVQLNERLSFRAF